MESSEQPRSCCAPARTGQFPTGPLPDDVLTAGNGTADTPPMQLIPGGEFLMGGEDADGFPADGEGPVRAVRLRSFYLAPHAVTNREFASFVAATGHRTDAEQFGWSYVFASFLAGRLRADASRPAGTPWWCGVSGAFWAAPEGPGSDVEGRQDHPVVHVSWRDAAAYCAWSGLRLPTEAEWERAARGGLEQARYPWGDELTPDGQHRCNIWNGRFPVHNTREDGYVGTAPVDAFPPNGFGLHNMSGNVWEWCADWWTINHPEQRPVVDPHGPAEGSTKVIRGGSYLCHRSYCNRYRVSARTSNTPDSSTGNMGFRCARDA